MSNRRRTLKERLARKTRRRCPKCKSSDVASKEYDDAWLHICQNPKCRFPVREVK